MYFDIAELNCITWIRLVLSQCFQKELAKLKDMVCWWYTPLLHWVSIYP